LGPYLARNFQALPQADLTWLCDSSSERLDLVGDRFP